MRPSVRRLETMFQDQVNFHELNIDLISSRDLTVEYRVSGIPRIVLLNADGTVFASKLGYQTDAQLIALVEELLAAQ